MKKILLVLVIILLGTSCTDFERHVKMVPRDRINEEKNSSYMTWLDRNLINQIPVQFKFVKKLKTHFYICQYHNFEYIVYIYTNRFSVPVINFTKLEIVSNE